MKLIVSALSLLAMGFSAQAQTSVLSQNFTNYLSQSLVGQNGWTQVATLGTSADSNNPIQIVNGQAVLSGSGQDVAKNFSSGITNVGGTSFEVDLKLSLQSVIATSTGDYVFYLTNSAFPTVMYERLYARSSGSGYVFGMKAFGSETTVWGSTVLSLNTDYDLQLDYNFVAGAMNDTFSMDVAGSSYLSESYTSGSNEALTFTTLNLRQGSTLMQDKYSTISVQETVAAVPEPNVVGIAVASLLGTLIFLRRRRSLLR